jgi:hypothetical protein
MPIHATPKIQVPYSPERNSVSIIRIRLRGVIKFLALNDFSQTNSNNGEHGSQFETYKCKKSIKINTKFQFILSKIDMNLKIY